MLETPSSLHIFYIKVKGEYPESVPEALKILLSFSTSCLHEAGFSAMTTTKTRLQSRLNLINTFQVLVSPIIPKWDHGVVGK